MLRYRLIENFEPSVTITTWYSTRFGVIWAFNRTLANRSPGLNGMIALDTRRNRTIRQMR